MLQCNGDRIVCFFRCNCRHRAGGFTCHTGDGAGNIHCNRIEGGNEPGERADRHAKPAVNAGIPVNVKYDGRFSCHDV